MTGGTRKALIVAVLHVLIVSTLGAKLLVDRTVRPRVWARTGPVDPDLPIRGRYVRLQIEAEPSAEVRIAPGESRSVVLRAANGTLVAVPSPTSGLSARVVSRDGRNVFVLNQPLAYFIPEHVTDPARRAPGEELWVEVTLPARGAPRPIRLGVKKDGVLTPLDLN